MKLSVIVPSLSGDVPRGLLNIAAQRSDIELIVVKGVSPVCAARNEGLSRASGDYIAWVDADDEIDGRWYECIAAEMKSNPDIITFDSRVEWHDGSGRPPYALRHGTHDFVSDYLRGKLPGQLWNKVFKSELVKGRQFKGACYEDTRFIDEILRDCHRKGRILRVVDIPVPLYTYKRRAAGLSQHRSLMPAVRSLIEITGICWCGDMWCGVMKLWWDLAKSMVRRVFSSKYCVAMFGAVLFCLVAPLLPFQDDWTYLTAPNPEFAWRDLLPGAAFWRPFDALWGGILGRAPWLFPWVNRVAIVLGHVLCVWLLIRMVDLLCEERRGRFAAVGFFALSSGIAAVIVNTDSLNLVWSCVWGCAGTLALLRGRMAWAVFVCYAVSILCKESGLSWLAVGPLFVYAKDFDGRRLARRLVVGFCLFAAYLGLRFALQGKVVLGNGGDYALTLSPVVIVKNLAILVGMSLSAVDGLAWVAGRLAVFIGTIILSVLMWGAFALCVDWRNRSDVMRRIFIGALVVLAFAAPHCLFKNHHPAEMHFYPVVLGGAFALAMITMGELRRIPLSVAVVLMVTVFAIGWCDKMVTIYATSARAEKLLANIKDEVKDFNVPKEYAVKADKNMVRYSIFSQSPAWCLDDGRALRCLNGWRETQVKIVEE